MEPEELRALLKKWLVIAAFFGLAVLFAALGWRRALTLYAVLVGMVAVLAILLQSGRGGGLATTFAGIGGDALLGVHSATPIAKATYVMLALFLFICTLRAWMGHNPAVPPPVERTQTSAPAPQQPPPSPPAPQGAQTP